MAKFSHKMPMDDDLLAELTVHMRHDPRQKPKRSITRKIAVESHYLAEIIIRNLQSALAKVPEALRSEAEISFRSASEDDDYDIWISYQGEETDAEYDERFSMALQFVANCRAERELELKKIEEARRSLSLSANQEIIK